MGRITAYRTLRGEAAKPFIPSLAALRIQVFREYPYLYEGDLSYEEKYLQDYSRIPDSVVVLALDGERVVGASTALPLMNPPLAKNSEFPPLSSRTPWLLITPPSTML